MQWALLVPEWPLSASLLDIQRPHGSVRGQGEKGNVDGKDEPAFDPAQGKPGRIKRLLVRGVRWAWGLGLVPTIVWRIWRALVAWRVWRGLACLTHYLPVTLRVGMLRGWGVWLWSHTFGWGLRRANRGNVDGGRAKWVRGNAWDRQRAEAMGFLVFRGTADMHDVFTDLSHSQVGLRRLFLHPHPFTCQLENV